MNPMRRPSRRIALDVAGVICVAGFLCYFGIYSPMQEGDPTPRGGRHNRFSIVSTYAIATILLIAFASDAIRCLRSGTAFIVGRSTRHRIRLRIGDRRILGVMFLEKGDSVSATLKFTEAPTGIIRCRIAIEKNIKEQRSHTLDVLEAEANTVWECDDSTEIVLPSCKSRGEYQVSFTVEAEQAGDVEAMVTLSKIPAMDSRRIA